MGKGKQEGTEEGDGRKTKEGKEMGWEERITYVSGTTR